MLHEQELGKARVNWQLGHHLFFAYVQALIVVCAKLAKSHERYQENRHQEEHAQQSIEEMRQLIDDASYILWGVAVTFKLTGAFSQAAYDGYVRPNMFEASEGFSGLWSHDHDYLVKKIMRQTKPLFEHPPEALEANIRNFRQAFAVMYDAHKYVCDKFEGGQPSLLMGESSRKTAAEMIDQFKRNRLLTLGVKC